MSKHSYNIELTDDLATPSVRWPGGTAPTLIDAVTNGIDIIRFCFDGTNYYGIYDLNFS